MQKIITVISEFQDKRRMNRDGVELVRQRIRILSGTDKVMMSMYYIDGCSYSRIAALMGINQSNVARRIRRITSRLLTGQYIRCLQNKRYFGTTELQIAKDYYVCRRTMRQIAQQRGSSFYEVRKAIARIEAILEAAEIGRQRTEDRQLTAEEG